MKKILLFLLVTLFISCDKDVFPFDEQSNNSIIIKQKEGLQVIVDKIETHSIIRYEKVTGKRVTGSYFSEEVENTLIMDFSIEKNIYKLEQIEWYYTENGVLKKASNPVSLNLNPLLFDHAMQSYKNVIKGYYNGELTKDTNKKTDVEIAFYIDFRK